MKLTDVGAPDRSFSRWLSDDEIGQVIAHKRGWRLAPDGRVIAGKILHRTIASSLAAFSSGHHAVTRQGGNSGAAVLRREECF